MGIVIKGFIATGIVTIGLIGKEEDTTSVSIVDPNGGSILSGELFTLRVPTGGLTGTSSVAINGIESTNINVISDTELTAIAGFIQEGTFEMVVS